jgi:succinylglutamic semialdehyde dehydrogenase
VTEFLCSASPADPTDEIGRFPVADAQAIEAAVARARAAFPGWRDAGLEQRSKLLRRFAEFVNERREELARLIAREVGKALWDARGEAALIGAKVEGTLGPGMDLVKELPAGAGARATYHPRGVLAVLGPFNFPAHLPNGHIVPALAAGNTVVFKPSDQAPAVGDWLARAWREAGLPPGVLETIHGGAASGSPLALHPDVDGVLFTGSWAVGRKLAEATLDQPHKLLALELGGKNAMIVWEDAELELAVAEAAVSIAASTGQRCSSLSRIFIAGAVADEFATRLRAVLRGLRIGPPLEDGVFMGPLISIEAWERVRRAREGAGEAGGERILGTELELEAPYLTPGLVHFSSLEQSHPYQRDELFAPEAALYPIDDLDQAIAAVNDSDYGLAASLMSRDRGSYEHCVGRVRTGIFNWNRGTIGASGRLPFGGGARSGNDRPAGLFSTLYCTWPQAHLEHTGGFDPATLPPGVPVP